MSTARKRKARLYVCQNEKCPRPGSEATHRVRVKIDGKTGESTLCAECFVTFSAEMRKLGVLGTVTLEGERTR